MLQFIHLLPLWQWWLVLALLLFALEVLTPGFILACFGVGALVTIPVAILEGSWCVQIVAFCAGSSLSLWLLQPLMCRWFASHKIRTGMEALLDREVLVSEAITDSETGGRVAVDGDSWRAICPSGKQLEVGRPVRIIGYQSVILLVEPI